MAKSQVQYGSQGSDVIELQKLLNKNGYSLTEDGIFGTNTQNAVKDYQKKYGLTVDGIVGTNTWGSLLGESASNTTDSTTDSTFKYDDFAYNDYQESDTVKNAYSALQAQLAQKPSEYNSQWQAQLDETINKILNREKFSYDLNGDALYQQYKDKYIQQGKMAMGDAIGQASAMTGGYGNSYAQSVGQQMYQKELQNLNDIVPELYQMAYDRYNQEGQDLYNQYALLGDRENMDYSRHRDSVSDWLTERDYLAGRYDSERTLDYSKYADDRTFKYGQYADDKSYAYQEHRNAIEDALAMEQFEYQKERDRIADEQWQKQYEAVYGTSSSGGGSGGGSGSGSSSGSSGGGSSSEGNEPVTPKEENVNVEVDLNYFIAKGATKSEINAYLRELLQDGLIDNAKYQELKNIYAPRGSTY